MLHDIYNWIEMLGSQPRLQDVNHGMQRNGAGLPD
jgi:hypothetical protein